MTRACEMCPEGKARRATLFCPADECFLCTVCDDLVHSANRLASRHVRRPIMRDDIADRSSINEDSELALVPDVAQLSQDRLSDPSSSEETLLMELPSAVPLSFEDAAEYDFCDFSDDGLGARMPALCAIDDDTLFAAPRNPNKSFYADVSWENVVSEKVQHVVPDVSESTTPSRSSSGMLYLKREPVEVDVKPKVVSAVLEGLSPEEVHGEKSKAGRVAASTGKGVVKSEDELSGREVSSVSYEEESVVGKKRARDEGVDDTSNIGQESEGDMDKERMERTAEQRKKRRMEALARFRNKRANRSFTKKVRYECRKQLADSRPRVKGRFVRKIEMALYRKYGALYRDHLDELKLVGDKEQGGERVGGDQRVPTM